MKDKDLAFSDQELMPIQTPKIGDKLKNIDSHLNELANILVNLSQPVYIVSGKRVEFEGTQEDMIPENMPDALSAIEHNAFLLTRNFRKCLDILSDSL